ncbi:hypothetical protein ACQP1V_23110 [Microtetraspora malaysiensis]|uniref:hypothetical protein n=1 Tax=Microtetraspora malaysiensis TaxID=161358 RepID=UPI003D94200A
MTTTAMTTAMTTADVHLRGFKDIGVGADDAREMVIVDGSWESARPYLGVPDA